MTHGTTTRIVGVSGTLFLRHGSKTSWNEVIPLKPRVADYNYFAYLGIFMIPVEPTSPSDLQIFAAGDNFFTDERSQKV
jgi:hypothetical protein